jgi:putative heme-binding domain-containing protein
MPACARSAPASIVFVLALLGSRLGAERPPWTTSRVRGTPEPESPYRVELVFPRLRFQQPIALCSLPGTNHLVIAEQGGKVYSFESDPACSAADLALDLRAHEPKLEALYGLTFHPGFARNRFVFLAYALKGELPEGTRLARFEVGRDDPPRILPSSETVLLTWRSGGHNGGCLEFGPDSYLYVSTGDAVGPNPPDTLDTGQDLDDLLSCILRIDVDPKEPGRLYAVPADNPFSGFPGARPEIWAYGFRNPWKIAFDPESGDLLAGDVGWDLWELVHRVERGGNYGWSAVEGRQPVRTDLPVGPTPIQKPLIEHAHTEAASVTGGVFCRSPRLRELGGAYIYGDYVTGKVWGLRQERGRVTWHRELADSQVQIVAFGEDPSGELYIVDHSLTGQIYTLSPNAPLSSAAGGTQGFPTQLSETGLFASVPEQAPATGVLRYTVAAEPWEDGAADERFLALPGSSRIEPVSHERWQFPEGTVLAKTVFAAGDHGARRAVETQLLHLEAGWWRPYTYAWDEDGADAVLVRAEGARASGWTFASRAECGLCHNYQAGFVLGANTYQLNRPLAEDPARNQLAEFEDLGVFARRLPGPREAWPRFAGPHDESAPLDARARSYLHANCAHCHLPNGGGMSPIQLTYWTDLGRSDVVDALPRWGAFGIDGARVVAPGDPSGSVLLYRLAKTGSGRMPRLGPRQVDVRGVRLVSAWIESLDPARRRELFHPPKTAAALELLSDGHDCGSSARSAAIDALAASGRGALSLLRLVEERRFPEAVEREVVRRAGRHRREEVRDLFERFLPEGERVRRLGDAPDPAVVLSLQGDPLRGREVFLSNAGAQCKSCHRAGGDRGAGGAASTVGPDLAGIGKKYAPPAMLLHLLEPSREVAAEFASYAVVTRTGEVLVGLVAERSERGIVLKDARGELRRVDAADVQAIERRAESLMPGSLLRDLTPEEAADLLAYLASL